MQRLHDALGGDGKTTPAVIGGVEPRLRSDHLERLRRVRQLGCRQVARRALERVRADANAFGVTLVDVAAGLAAAVNADAAVKALQHTAGFLRSALSHRLTLYSVPQLHFAYDDSIESGMKLSQLIDDAVAADRKLSR